MKQELDALLTDTHVLIDMHTSECECMFMHMIVRMLACMCVYTCLCVYVYA